MPVQLRDSYIVQWRDLIQYLIGQIEADGDHAAGILALACHIQRRSRATDQYLIIEMERVPRQNMSLHRLSDIGATTRLFHRRPGDGIRRPQQIVQQRGVKTRQRILLLPLLMANQNHVMGRLGIHDRHISDRRRSEINIERARYITGLILNLHPIQPVTRDRGLIAKLAGAGNIPCPSQL